MKQYVVNIEKMSRKLGYAQDKKGTEKMLKEFLGVSQPTLSKWKAKAPNILVKLKKYSDLTGESIESILEEK